MVCGECALRELCESHGLAVRNMRHLVGMFGGNGKARHVSNWTLLSEVRWLQREGAQERVPVVGSLDHFLATVAAERDDMPFKKDRLRQLLAGTLTSHKKPTDTYTKYKWRVVPAPPDASRRANIFTCTASTEGSLVAGLKSTWEVQVHLRV